MITVVYKGKHYKIEYSIVNVSELEGALRIDAEYYDPFWIKILEEPIKRKEYDFVKNRTHFIKKGIFDISPSFYRKNGIPFIRVLNCHDEFIDENDLVFLNEETHKKYKNLELNFYDIVMSKVGTLGEISINLKFEKINFSQNNIGVKVDTSSINPFYLFAFLKSEYSIMQIERTQSGNIQQKLVLEDIRNLRIPIPSDPFQKLIEKLVLNAYKERRKAEQLYKLAEEILLEELGLKDWEPKTKKIKIGDREFEEEENISIRRFSEVKRRDRFDAEYWEPKYDEIEKIIKNYKKGYDCLPKLVNVSKEKIKIDKGGIYNYIELADINTNLGLVNQTKEIRGDELPSRARMKVDKGYVVMSSVEGSIDKIALIDFDKPNLVASTGFFVFEEKKVNKETLLVLLKILAKRYLVREAQGTILTAIPYDSLKRIILPYVDLKVQQKISQLIQQSFKSRGNSKKLLEIAKRAVEIYIEKDETEGQKYISEQLQKLEINLTSENL